MTEKTSHPDFSDILSVVALIVAAAAALFTWQDFRLSKDLAHLHLTPMIRIIFEQSDSGNPKVIIQNSGAIPAVSLSARHNVFVYDRNKSAIALFVVANQMYSDNMTFKDVLKPMEQIEEPLIKIGPTKNLVAMYQFDVTCYRDTDMKAYDQNDLFFVDNEKVYSHKEYRSHPDYEPLMKSLAAYRPPTMTVGQASVIEPLKAKEGKKE